MGLEDLHNDQIQTTFWRMQITLLVRWINIMGESVPFVSTSSGLLPENSFFLFISIANFASHLSCFIVLIGNETGKSNVSLTFRKKDLKAFAVLRHPCVLYLLIVSGVSFRWEWLKIHVFLLFPYKRIKLLVLVGFSLSLEYPNSVWGCA